jgi:hypothetical protein
VALVVFLRGVNVGGHRTFRPSLLAQELEHVDAVNIGAAGTFVIRRPCTPAQLRSELARRLPFVTEIMICQGREIVRLVSDIQTSPRDRRRSLGERLVQEPCSAPPTPISFLPVGWLPKTSAGGLFRLRLYRR